MNIQNAAGAVTFSVLSGVLLNVLLPGRAPTSRSTQTRPAPD
jgi:hypothetical protein